MNINDLKKLAMAATEGPWIAAGPSFGAPFPVKLDSVVQEDGIDGYSICSDVDDPADAEYIAAASPDVVLALIAEVEASRAAGLQERATVDMEPVAWTTDFEFENVMDGFSTSLTGRAIRINPAFPKAQVIFLYTATQLQQAVAQEQRKWLKENAPGGWIDDQREALRQAREALIKLSSNSIAKSAISAIDEVLNP